MKIRKLYVVVLIFTLVFSGGCSVLSFAPARPAGSDVALTAAAETVIAQLTPLPLTQTAQVTITATPIYQPTQPPTATLEPKPSATLAPLAAMPVIEVLYFSYCWESPGENTPIVAIIYPGDTFTPLGTSVDRSWWYVSTPKQHRKIPSDHCWIYRGITKVSGDPTNVPIIGTPTPG